jgi:hypothetical protein
MSHDVPVKRGVRKTSLMAAAVRDGKMRQTAPKEAVGYIIDGGQDCRTEVPVKDMRLTLDTYPGEPPAANKPEDAATSLAPGLNLIDADAAKESTKVRGDCQAELRGIQGRAGKVSRVSRVSLVFAGFRRDNSDPPATSLEAFGDGSGLGIGGILGMPVSRALRVQTAITQEHEQ